MTDQEIANLLPLGDRILVREIEKKTEGAIVLAQSGEGDGEGPRAKHCEIVAVGAQVTHPLLIWRKAERRQPDGTIELGKEFSEASRGSGERSRVLIVGAKVYIDHKYARISDDLYVIAAEDVLLVERVP